MGAGAPPPPVSHRCPSPQASGARGQARVTRGAASAMHAHTRLCTHGKSACTHAGSAHVCGCTRTRHTGMHTHVDTYMHAHIHRHMYADTHVQTHTCGLMQADACTHRHTWMHTCGHTCRHMHAHTYTCTQTHADARGCTRMCAHTHRHTQAHTHVRMRPPAFTVHARARTRVCPVSAQEGAPPRVCLARGPHLQVLGATKHSGSSGGICGPSPWGPPGPSLSPPQPPRHWPCGVLVTGRPRAQRGGSRPQGVLLAAGSPGAGAGAGGRGSVLSPRPGSRSCPFVPRPREASRAAAPAERAGVAVPRREPPCSLPPLLGPGPRWGAPSTRQDP